MTPEELDYLVEEADRGRKTANDLYLANLGAFEDDPAADDVYLFAFKMNENVLLLDEVTNKVTNNTLSVEMLREKGLFGVTAYGGRLGTPVSP